MRNADAPLRLADIWAFCHARLNETASALLNHQHDHQATPYRDTDFGLADIAFKRSLLEEHAPDFQTAAKGYEVTPMAVCRVDGDTCPFTQQLAALYSTHPDYQESWRP